MARADLLRAGNSLFYGAGVAWSDLLFNLDDAGEFCGGAFQTPEQVTMTHLGVAISTTVGTPPRYRVSVRNLLADGSQSPNIITAGTFQPPADGSWDGTFQWIELDAPYTSPRGNYLAYIIDYATGPIGSTNHATFLYGINGSRSNNSTFPYTLSSNAIARTADEPVFGYRTRGRSYGMPVQALKKDPVQSPASTGLRFWMNPLWGSSYKVLGAEFLCQLSARTGRTVDMVLYESDLNELHRVSLDCDIHGSPGADDGLVRLLFDDSTLATLSTGTEYFIMFEPGEVDTDFWLREVEIASAQDQSAFPGGLFFYSATRATAASDFVRAQNRRPQLSLLIDDWTG